MSSPARRFTEDHYTGAVVELDDSVVSCEDDEFDDLSDPFVILAAKEERAGVPLYHLSRGYDD